MRAVLAVSGWSLSQRRAKGQSGAIVRCSDAARLSGSHQIAADARALRGARGPRCGRGRAGSAPSCRSAGRALRRLRRSSGAPPEHRVPRRLLGRSPSWPVPVTFTSMLSNALAGGGAMASRRRARSRQRRGWARRAVAFGAAIIVREDASVARERVGWVVAWSRRQEAGRRPGAGRCRRRVPEMPAR